MSEKTVKGMDKCRSIRKNMVQQTQKMSLARYSHAEQCSKAQKSLHKVRQDPL